MHSAAAHSLTDAVAALAAVISCEAEGRMVAGDALALDDDLRRHAVRVGARRIGIVGGALHEMRALIGHLRPAQFEDRAGCETSAHWQGKFPINGVSITQRITLYRILEETLTNAQRHGRATHVSVRATEDRSGVTLEVTDNDAGFDPIAVRRRRPGMPLARFGPAPPLYRAKGLEASYGVDRLYLKREDLCHTGAHKINNALGQVLLASKMGKKRIIAETGAGQHGVATATAAA